MRKTLTIVIYATILGLSSTLFAHNRRFKTPTSPELAAPDTLYYLADTAHIPTRDRIFKVESSYMATDFYIYCSCLNTEQGYIYLVGADRRSFVIDKKRFGSLKLTSLADLISIIKTYNTRDFGGQYVIYIILPKGKEKYTLYPVINRSNGIIQRMK